MAKLKNSNCDKTKKKKIVTKLEISNCDQTQKLNLCKTKKIKLWQLKSSNCDGNKMTVVTEVVIMTYFSLKHLNTLTTDQLSGQLFATLAMFLKHLNMAQSYGSGSGYGLG